MKKIVMMSKADMVKGQGVLSAHDEQVALVREFLNEYEVEENKGIGDITHIHTINPSFLLRLPFAKLKGSSVGYVHFLPQTNIVVVFVQLAVVIVVFVVLHFDIAAYYLTAIHFFYFQNHFLHFVMLFLPALLQQNFH